MMMVDVGSPKSRDPNPFLWWALLFCFAVFIMYAMKACVLSLSF